MNWYERATHGWDGDKTLADHMPVACYLAVAAPVLAILLIGLANHG